jgi:SAM-dependent methyltransferase
MMPSVKGAAPSRKTVEELRSSLGADIDTEPVLPEFPEIGASLLRELLPLLAGGCYLPALESLRERLTQIRAVLTPEQWRKFCVQSFSAKQFGQHAVSRPVKGGPLQSAKGPQARRQAAKEFVESLGAETDSEPVLRDFLQSGCAGTARGLIHEPLILDVIYGFSGAPEDSTPAAEVLRPWELALGFCASLRERHLLFVRELSDLGNIVCRPRVLAVGCGHLREAAAALCLENMRGAELIAFDRDRACIDLIEREYEHAGLRTISGSLRALTNDSTLGKFDFIYLPTLLDTLEDLRVQKLIGSLLPLLKPGGRLLAANFSQDLPDAAYLEACLDWWPFYRGEEELAALLSPLHGQNLRGQTIFRDDSGGSVFLELQAI